MPFPTNQFVSGHVNPVQWQAIGQGLVSTLNVTGSSWDEEINTILVTHSGSGGLAARIANILDGKGTVNADLDLFAPPYLNVPGIVAGGVGALLIYVGPGRPFQIPAIIKKVHYEQTVMTEVHWSFDIEMNSLVGLYVRPQS
jgi:hypothetical protein